MWIHAIAAIMGLAGTIALTQTMSFEMERTAYSNSMGAFLFVVSAFCILRYVYAHIRLHDKRGVVCSVVYSAALSFALTVGKQLHTVENFAVADLLLWIRILVLTLFFFGPVLYVLQEISQKFSPKEESIPVSFAGKKDFLFTWLVIFLCWIPVFLALYPGAFVYDAQDEYVQVATREFTTHHPLLHVLLLGGSVCFGNKFMGSYNAGIALYTLFQMAVLSAVFAYTIIFLRNFFSEKICVCIALFYGLFPLFPMYAVCSAKDPLFSASFLLMLVHMAKILKKMHMQRENGQKKTVAFGDHLDEMGFVFSGVCMMLFRNNGMMAYAALWILVCIAAFFLRKNKGFWMRFAALMLLSLMLFLGVSKTLSFATDAKKGGSQEILTVPIQQLTRTYKYSPEVFSENDREILLSYIPEDILAVYDADLSDLVKIHFDNAKFAEDPTEFLGLWLRIFVKKPVTYLNAWFMTSYGFWYPDTVINVYGGLGQFTFQYEDSSYFGFETEPPGERDSKFPWLEEQYRKMSLELYQQNVPGISMLFSPGFMFWVFMGCACITFYRREYDWLLPMTAVFLLWATFLLGPTFLVRYVLILWFALPLMLVPVFVPDTKRL